MKRFLAHSWVLTLVTVVIALVIAIAITSVVFLASGVSPPNAFSRMLEHGTRPHVLVTIVNDAVTLYLAAVAVAIGFKMRLFNIGVEGQHILAVMLAAAVGGYLVLPPGLHQLVIVLTAMIVGAVWAGIAGLLKVTRGVHEVIATIMLNFIALSLVMYLLEADRLGELVGNNLRTPPIGPSGQVPGIPGSWLGLAPDRDVYGLLLLAVAVGIGYWMLLNRTRFGFELRATGQSPTAAQAGGVRVKRMIMLSMLISGAIAGLVGLPQLLGDAHNYSLAFPEGIGFLGIAVALLGRNHPVGIAFAALFWSFLTQSAEVLSIDGIPREISVITQASMVLSVVIVYEIVHRWGRRYQQQRVGEQLGRAEARS